MIERSQGHVEHSVDPTAERVARVRAERAYLPFHAITAQMAPGTDAFERFGEWVDLQRARANVAGATLREVEDPEGLQSATEVHNNLQDRIAQKSREAPYPYGTVMSELTATLGLYVDPWERSHATLAHRREQGRDGTQSEIDARTLDSMATRLEALRDGVVSRHP